MIKLSCDDGCVSDIRLAELAKKYGIDCTFYLPVEWHSLAHENAYQPLGYSDATAISREFELGAHTITHRHLTKLEPEEAKYEIEECKWILETLFNTEVTKFCPPRGYTNAYLDYLILPFYESRRLTRDVGLVHIHPESGANDNKPWRQCVTDETIELWCHSWELDKYDLWDELGEFLRENSYR